MFSESSLVAKKFDKNEEEATEEDVKISDG